MCTIADTTFKITNTKLCVPIVTLSSKDNVKLVKLLEEGFKRPVCWNEYKTKTYTKNSDENNLTTFYLAFDNSNDNNKKVERNSQAKYFFPRINVTNYNVLIYGRNFYDQLINDQIKQYDKIRKTATGQGDDYTTGCLLYYQYFKGHYKLIADDFGKQKELDAGSRAIQQIEFYGMLKLTHKCVQF